MVEREQILKEFIDMSINLIASDGLEGVKHYLKHGEYEMAFEGLVIELYTTGKYPKGFNFTKWKHLAISYELDKESVFDEKFWKKFNEWGEAYITRES